MVPLLSSPYPLVRQKSMPPLAQDSLVSIDLVITPLGGVSSSNGRRVRGGHAVCSESRAMSLQKSVRAVHLYRRAHNPRDTQPLGRLQRSRRWVCRALAASRAILLRSAVRLRPRRSAWAHRRAASLTLAPRLLQEQPAHGAQLVCAPRDFLFRGACALAGRLLSRAEASRSWRASATSLRSTEGRPTRR